MLRYKLHLSVWYKLLNYLLLGPSVKSITTAPIVQNIVSAEIT